MIKTVFSAFLLLLLNSCSSRGPAGVVYHQSFNFSQVKTYSLYSRSSDFTESQGLIDSRRNAIEIAIERVMGKKHFDYTEPEEAEVIVTYHLLDGKRGDYSKYNEVVHFCHHCLRASAWQKEQQYSSLALGDLIIDLVDPIRNRSVWRSVYPLDLEPKDNSAQTNEKIQQAVSLMLAQYPTEKTIQ